MLIITRRVGERILIGKDVWIVVADVQGHRVRLGIEAPREVSVSREELLPAQSRWSAQPEESE